MTHDELLEKLTDYEAHFDQVRDEEKAYNALRAVVELHKPERITIEGFKTEYWCMADNNEPTPYPCPTILQIEKEIK